VTKSQVDVETEPEKLESSLSDMTESEELQGEKDECSESDSDRVGDKKRKKKKLDALL